jgi:hypothetical protein
VNGERESLVIAGRPQIGYHGAWAITDAASICWTATPSPVPSFSSTASQPAASRRSFPWKSSLTLGNPA